MRELSAGDRAALRGRLRHRYAWLRPLSDIGPQTVDAGECDRCGAEARLVTVCGPGAWEALGRRCAAELGAEAWCPGHADDAARQLVELAGLPPEADTVARLWWVTTGEVRVVGDVAAALDAQLDPTIDQDPAADGGPPVP